VAGGLAGGLPGALAVAGASGSAGADALEDGVPSRPRIALSLSITDIVAHPLSLGPPWDPRVPFRRTPGPRPAG
jgi:hypothetical protein